MNLLKACTFTICLLCSLKHFGQQPTDQLGQQLSKQVGELVVSGRLLDGKGEPVIDVTVYASLLQKPMTVVKGCLPDSTGNFTLRLPGGSVYIVTVRGVGHKTYSAKTGHAQGEHTLGDIVMEEAKHRISEVVVRPPIEVTADRVIFNMESDPDRATSDMYKMIQKMPLIGTTTQGHIYVGSEDKKYMVLRKGREDALFNFTNIRFDEMLKKLPAMGFTTFEIWTVVPPRFGDYDYVINILPDPNARLFGAIGQGSSDHSIPAGSMGLIMAVNGSADLFRFSTNGRFRDYDSPESSSATTTRIFETDIKPEITINKNSIQETAYEYYMPDMKISMDISKHQFVTLSGKTDIQDNYSLQVTGIDSITSGVSTTYESVKTTLSYSRPWQFEAAWQLEFEKKARVLNISYLLSSSPYNSKDRLAIAYDSSGGRDRDRFATSTRKDISHRVQADYSDAFNNRKYLLNIGVGYLIKDYDMENLVYYGGQIQESDTEEYRRLEQDMHRVDGYVNTTWNPSRRLSVFSTLRADYLPDYNVTKVTTGLNTENISQKKLMVSPNAGFKFDFNIKQPEKKSKPKKENIYDKLPNMLPTGMCNSSVRLDYIYSQHRPGISHLTNYSNVQDPLYVERGNPFLDPESSHELRLGVMSSWLGAYMFSYNFSNDKIVPLTTLETSGDETVLVRSYYNAGQYRFFSANISEIKLYRRILSLNPSYSSSYTDYGNDTYQRNRQFRTNLRYNQSLPGRILSTTNLGYKYVYNSGAGGSKPEDPFSLSVSLQTSRRLFGNPLLIGANFNDLIRWRKSKSESFSKMAGYESYSSNVAKQLPVSISLTYMLGKFKVKPVKRARQNATVEGFSTDK